MINEILKPQGLYKTRESGYTPIIGDLIYFKNLTSTAVSTHVGLVIGVRDGYVYTVEGNGGERVARHKYALDDSYIVGYGALKYETKDGTDYSVFSLEEDSAKPGKFVVTADSLNVRAGSRCHCACDGCNPVPDLPWCAQCLLRQGGLYLCGYQLDCSESGGMRTVFSVR